MTQDTAQRAEELLSILKSDETLARKFAEASTPEERKKVLAEAGFEDVSSDEFRRVAAAKTDAGELSEEELSAAAGAGGIHIKSIPTPIGPIDGIDIDW